LSGLLHRGGGLCRGAEIRQQEQRALDKQRNILAVAGLMQPGMSADEVADIFAAHIRRDWWIWPPVSCWIKTRQI
jgi:uridylate kinase